MFKMLKDLLLNVSSSLAHTNYLRIVLTASVIIPLVITLYGYFDDVITNANDALNSIQDVTISDGRNSVSVGYYAVSLMGLAQLHTVLITIFTYLTTAVVWSFTYDLKPMFTRK